MLSFDDIIGQESIVQHLKTAISDGKVSHAYIISGEEGSGKMMIAERFAAALMCTGEGEKPCGTCISCMQSQSRNHPDIIYVTHEKNNILVDDIRNGLVNDISIKPYQSDYKVYIIDDASRMNEAAQNALLKTLEEPPAYAVILLLAENTGSFLPTILSRCVTLQIKPVDTPAIKRYLMETQKLPDYLASLCASFSGGCIGKAVKYAEDEKFARIREEVLKLVSNIDDMSEADISDFLEAFSKDKEKKAAINDYLDLLDIWYRDILMFKATQDANRLIFAEEVNTIRKQASLRSFENLNNISLAVEKARKRINANVRIDVTLRMLTMTLREHC